MTALVLVELDGAEPADASLRALTLARSISDVNAVIFATAVPQDTLASYGVTDVYVIEPSSLDGYAPRFRKYATRNFCCSDPSGKSNAHAGIIWLGAVSCSRISRLDRGGEASIS